LEIEEI
jgi:hypothetical protein